MSPNSCSRSGGASTSRCRMLAVKPGATSSTCAHARSAIASRSAGQSLGGRLARHPLHEQRRDVAAGRREARVERRRQRELDERAIRARVPRARPRTRASSASRSLAPTWIVPRCSGPGAAPAAWPRNAGSRSSARLIFTLPLRKSSCATLAAQLVGQVARAPSQPSSVTRGSAPETTSGASIAVPSASTTPRAAPSAHLDPRDRRGEPDLRARLARGRGDRLGEPAHAALDVRPHAARAAGLAHHVVEEHITRARRRGRRPGADHRVGRERGAQRLALEPALELGPRRAEQERERARELAAQPPRARAERARAGAGRARAGAPGRAAARRAVGSSQRAIAVEERLVLGIALGVAARERRDRVARGLRRRRRAAARARPAAA